MCPSVRPDAAPQFQSTVRGQRPRPWSRTAQVSPGSLPKVRISRPMRTRPVAGSAVCLEVYWKRCSLHGTTTESDSCPSGRCTRMSTSRGRRSGVRQRARSLVPAVLVADLDAHLAPARAGGADDDVLGARRTGDGVGEVHTPADGDDRGTLELAAAGAEFQDVHRVQRQEVEVAHGEGHQMGGRGHAPVLPPLRPAPAPQIGPVQRLPGPADRRRIQAAVGQTEVDGLGDLVLVRRHDRSL